MVTLGSLPKFFQTCLLISSYTAFTHEAFLMLLQCELTEETKLTQTGCLLTRDNSLGERVKSDGRINMAGH